MTAAGGADKRLRAVTRAVTRAANRRQIDPAERRVPMRNGRLKTSRERRAPSLLYRRTNARRRVGTGLAINGCDIGGK